MPVTWDDEKPVGQIKWDDAQPAPVQQPDASRDATLDEMYRRRGLDPRARIGYAAYDRAVKPLVNAVSNPVETLKSLTGANDYVEAGKEFKQGNLGKGFGHLAMANPASQLIKGLVKMPKEMIDSYGEAIGEGDPAKVVGMAGGEVGVAAALAAPGRLAQQYVAPGMLNKGAEMNQAAFKPAQAFRKHPDILKDEMVQAGQNKIYPDLDGLAKADELVDERMLPMEQTYAANAGQRLPMDRFDKSQSLYENGQLAVPETRIKVADTGSPSVTSNIDITGKAPRETALFENQMNPKDRSVLRGVNEEARRMKFAKASPQEREAAKQAVADKINNTAANAFAALTKKPHFRLDPSDVTDEMVSLLDYPSTATVEDLVRTKQILRSSYQGTKGKLVISSITDVMSSEAADAINRILVDAFPGLKEAGLEASKAIDLRQIVRDRIGVAGNNTFGGIMTPLAVASGAPVGKSLLKWITYGVFHDPVAKSKMASRLIRASGGAVTTADAYAALNGIEARLQLENETEAKEDAANHAKH